MGSAKVGWAGSFSMLRGVHVCFQRVLPAVVRRAEPVQRLAEAFVDVFLSLATSCKTGEGFMTFLHRCLVDLVCSGCSFIAKVMFFRGFARFYV